MAETATDGLHMHPGADEMRAMRVAKVVKSKSWTIESCRPSLELLRDAIGVQLFARLASEDQARVCPARTNGKPQLRLTRSVGTKQRRRRPVEVDAAAPRIRLRGRLHHGDMSAVASGDNDQLLPNVDRALVEIDVAPPESADLSSS